MLKKVIIWLVKTIFSAFVEEIHNRRKEEDEDESTTSKTAEKGK